MPSKGKRVASRQGNLRRRRNSANRSNAPAGSQPTAVANPPSTLTADDSGPATATATAMATAAAAPAGAGVAQAVGRPQAQPRGRRFDRPAAYNHVGPELVRISIFAGTLLAALIVVSFVI